MTPLKAKYDLARMPANYNFLEWLVAATTLGATHVCIDASRIKPKYNRADTRRRLDNIVAVACALAGVSHSFDTKGVDLCYYHISAVLDVYQKTGGIKKLKSVLPHGNERYTVTLRNYERYPQRNSNERAWRRFASDIGALVIEDWYVKPIGLHERMALYCGAQMNFHVANGPAALCYLSDAPCTVFLKGVDVHYHEIHRFPVGSQLPWLNPNQRMVWQDDTYENLCQTLE